MSEIITIYKNETIDIKYDTSDLCIQVTQMSSKGGKKVWHSDKRFKPAIYKKNGEEVKFESFEEISHTPYESGAGTGVRSAFSTMKISEAVFCFETVIWYEVAAERLHFDLIPLKEDKGEIEKIIWPVPFEFDKREPQNVTVVPMMYGCIIPNGWEKDVQPVSGGIYYERSAYMPWWGQIEDGYGYIAVADTPWDGGYHLEHKAGGCSRIGSVWYPSLDQIAYERSIHYSFVTDSSYTTLAKIYRNYIKENGRFVTLKEKILRAPRIEELIGTPVIHTSIYYHNEPDSLHYDTDNPENNDDCVRFDERLTQLTELKDKVEKTYIHLDGWGYRGYDNLHPDVFPPCEQAGGWKGMKALVDGCHDLGYLLAIHDQYRDYYYDAGSFDENKAIHDSEGNIPIETIWAGGKQAFLCPKYAPEHLRRNMKSFEDHGVALDGAYLDVFSCIELDECYHEAHKLSRKECVEYRQQCFSYVSDKNMIVSSEECVDWAIEKLALVHHSPIALEVELDGWHYTGPAIGIPVPLFNLVYHECVVVPWALHEKGWGIPEGQDGFLYALLNAGTGYLPIDADDDSIAKNRIVCELHERLVNQEMVDHKMKEGNPNVQIAEYDDGTTVEVDFLNNNYKIRN